jgi:hypothetical protein
MSVTNQCNQHAPHFNSTSWSLSHPQRHSGSCPPLILFSRTTWNVDISWPHSRSVIQPCGHKMTAVIALVGKP